MGKRKNLPQHGTQNLALSLYAQTFYRKEIARPDRAKDRADLELIQSIQGHFLSLQAHHAEILERDIKLIEENAALRKKQVEGNEEEVRIYKAIEFRRGKRTGKSWLPFCPKCHMPAKAVFSEYEGNFAFCSAECGWRVDVNPHLDDVTKELAAKPHP